MQKGASLRPGQGYTGLLEIMGELSTEEWEFWMYRCCTDPNTGEKYGWGRVLDYIGVEWEDIPAVQMNLEDFLK